METTTQKKQYYPTVKQASGLLLKLILLSIPLAIPLVFIGLILKNMEIEQSITDGLIFLSLYIVLFVITIRIGLQRIRSANDPDFKLKIESVSAPVIFISIIVIIALIIISEPLSLLIPMPDSVKAYFEKMIQPNILSFISVAVAAPILEEILFRGIILEGFLQNYSPQKAIIWSAVLFGVFHLNPWQAIGAIIFGLFFGWLYWKTNSIIPGIILHFVNNFAAFVLTFGIDKNIETLYQLINNWAVYTTVFISSIAILIVGLRILKKRFNNLEITTNEVINNWQKD